MRGDRKGPVIVLDGATGSIRFFDRNLNETMILDAVSGDLKLLGADCAEDFDVEIEGEPGSVMRLGERGRVLPTNTPYDRRVAGVVSGAGRFRPALRLDRAGGRGARQPIALMGKVDCLVDASAYPVAPGDLLTSSSTPGHAMAATDTLRATGAIIGKSLGSMDSGRGLLPVLVMLR
jgi:hypothetical protein